MNVGMRENFSTVSKDTNVLNIKVVMMSRRQLDLSKLRKLSNLK
jgi:hypothetical protein